MIKGLIFDMDGTITLTEPLHYQAFAEVFKNYGISYSFNEHLKKYAATGSKNIFTKVFAEKGKLLDEKALQQCMARKKELYTKFVQESEIVLVKGVSAFVQRVVRAGLKKIIATGNSNLDVVRVILKKVGLIEYFPNIISNTEVAHGKPFPDVFLQAARRIGCEPAECIVFEDSINGVKAAFTAGIPCIALKTTASKEELLSAGATKVVKDFTEVTDKMLQTLSR